MIRDALRAVLEALVDVLFTCDCVGEEKIPPTGGAIVWANHPSYLDRALLSLPVKRPILFTAGDYDSAEAHVREGSLVGIFPEGRRSRAGWMDEERNAGAARLALETGAPLVPATIRGAFRAWPYFRAQPEPAKIRVRFHDPIDPAHFHSMPDGEATAALLAELRRRVEKTLLPGVKAERRIEELHRTPAPWPRFFEAVPALGLALLVFWKTRSFAVVWPAYAYVGYLLLDLLAIPQRRLTKWVRNGSAAVFVLVYGGWVLPKLGLPAPVGGTALLAVLAGAGFPYLYERGRLALAFVQGLVAAALLEVGALHLVATPVGAHLALPLFAGAFAWEERTVFWRYGAPILAAYAFGIPVWLGGGFELLPHAIAGLLAWGLVRFLPRAGGGGAAAEEEPDETPTSTLGLRD